MNNSEIRRKILELLYQADEECPGESVERKTLKDKLHIEDNKLDSNMLYMEEKNYVELYKSIDAVFDGAQITAYGKDLVENKEPFNRDFPISITQISVKNSAGVVIGDGSSAVVSMSDSFNDIYQNIEKRNPPNKEEIIKVIKEVEEELKKESINKSNIKRLVEFLKTNASWIIPSLHEILKNVVT